MVNNSKIEIKTFMYTDFKLFLFNGKPIILLKFHLGTAPHNMSDIYTNN